MSDSLVFIDGRLQSAQHVRMRQRIERDLAKLEFDVAMIEGEIEMAREAQEEAAWRRRHGR